ncbi:MAG TPA: LURP-one-related family protein [Candidatus Atribacteria bacterium]|nr:LURP-one-related family protein [Candidatus Atribacteria bacterium]HPT78684.1 LURP-one-related family protein [Candidatus Atribacteria bacterium]
MRYVVKQRVFSFGDNFTIKDEAGNDCFVVKGKVFTFGDKLSMYDMYGQELVYIEQKLFRFLPEYSIYYKGQLYATVKKEFTFFRPRFNIHSHVGSYSIQGEFFNLDFSIFKGGRHVATVSKKWLSWGDTYGVDIADDEDHPFILALVIVIDQVLHDDSKQD